MWRPNTPSGSLLRMRNDAGAAQTSREQRSRYKASIQATKRAGGDFNPEAIGGLGEIGPLVSRDIDDEVIAEIRADALGARGEARGVSASVRDADAVIAGFGDQLQFLRARAERMRSPLKQPRRCGPFRSVHHGPSRRTRLVWRPGSSARIRFVDVEAAEQRRRRWPPGLRKSSSGAPRCTMRPALKIRTWSASAKHSSGSCVTRRMGICRVVFISRMKPSADRRAAWRRDRGRVRREEARGVRR